MITGIKRILIGKPLKTEQLEEEKLPIWKALPILSSDALSSLAYGTEQLLIVLAPFGTLALWYSLPITLAIIGLLTLLILSYRQVIFQYPGGGGAYIVSHDNLGWFPALIAGSSLLIDYTLTCAVSVTGGTAAITSAFPKLLPYSTSISVGFVLLIMLLNLRGLRESGTIFAFPTYLFMIGIAGLVISGLVTVAVKGIPAHTPPFAAGVPEGLTLFILLRAFSSGCTALTGVEAVSNATPTFREPETKNAARTLAILGLSLGTLFAGTSFLAYIYGIVPSETETVLSQIARQTFGTTLPYYYVQATTALILILAANTAFSGFPLLASIMARDKFMPRMFAARGDRLNFSNGIILLAIASILLIVAFEGDIHRLIPLYAIGVFLSFTLAQAGMVRRWWVKRPAGWIPRMLINAAGALVSFVVLLIFAITKFAEGAWIVIIVIPVSIFVFYQIRRHYEAVGKQLRIDLSKPVEKPKEHIVVLPIGGVNRVVQNSVAYAKLISDPDRVIALYVAFDEEQEKKVQEKWEQWNPGIRLVTTRSRYRSIIDPLLRFIDHLQSVEGREITVLIPEFIPARWWQRLLHNQTALLIRFVLLLRKDVAITTIPFHLSE